MKFSIIVPIYKVETFLHQCVDSVLNQNYQDFELILVDDGSTDECPTICDKYAKKDNRVRVIHKKNGGLVSARKAGVETAKGDYCIPLDGDDWLEDGCLERLSDVIGKYSPDVIRFGYIIASEENKIFRSVEHYRLGFYNRDQIDREIMPSLIYSDLGYAFPSSIWGECVLRSLYKEEQMAVPDEITIGEDFAVTKPIITKASSLYIMSDCLYSYRTNMASMTKNKKPFNLRNYTYRYKHILDRIDVDYYGLRNQLNRSTAHGLFNAYATQFYQEKSYRDIKRDILISMEEEPYKTIISEVEFDRPLSRKLMEFVLKKHLIFMIWLYSKIR